MKDQINASKILHSSAIYIQSMKTTRSLCKESLMIKSVKCFFTPSTNTDTTTYHTNGSVRSSKGLFAHTKNLVRTKLIPDYLPHTKIVAIRLVEMQSHDQRYFAYHFK